MLRFPIDGRGAAAGVAIALAMTAFVLAFSGVIWRVERVVVDRLLRFSNTPATVHQPDAPAFGISSLVHGGATFVVPSKAVAPSVPAAAAGIGLVLAATVLILRSPRVPAPGRVIWLIFACVTLATLWYTTWVSPAPPHHVGSLTIGFMRSGLLGIMIATVLFALEIFPVPGPLRVKVAWLAGLVSFAVVWSVVRMAVALATVTHVGSWTFLYLHYATGPFMDFLYVVAFYSFATYSLAGHAERSAIA